MCYLLTKPILYAKCTENSAVKSETYFLKTSKEKKKIPILPTSNINYLLHISWFKKLCSPL